MQHAYWLQPCGVKQLYLIRKSKRQLLMYSLDKGISFSMFLLTLASQNGSSEAPTFILNYLIDYLRVDLRDYSLLPHNCKK